MKVARTATPCSASPLTSPKPSPDSSSAASRLHARRLFPDLFPFLRLSFLVSNQAILEAMEGDLGGSDRSQWIALLQSLAARQGGPPHLRITVVGESREFLAHMASNLSEEAEKLDIPGGELSRHCITTRPCLIAWR